MCTHTHLCSLACYIAQPSEMFMHTVWLYHNIYKIRVYCYWLHCFSVLRVGFGKVVLIISWQMNSDFLCGLCFGYVQHSVLNTVPQKLVHAEQFHLILQRQMNIHKIFLDKYCLGFFQVVGVLVNISSYRVGICKLWLLKLCRYTLHHSSGQI